MQFTSTLILSSVATLAAAMPAVPRDGTGVEIVFTTYNNSDMTCADSNVAGSIGIPTTGPVGSCIQFPYGTSSIEYRVPAYSTEATGCTVDLWTGNTCLGPAIESFQVKNGELQCKPPLGGGWESVRVTCSSS